MRVTVRNPPPQRRIHDRMAAQLLRAALARTHLHRHRATTSQPAACTLSRRLRGSANVQSRSGWERYGGGVELRCDRMRRGAHHQEWRRLRARSAPLYGPQRALCQRAHVCANDLAGEGDLCP